MTPEGKTVEALVAGHREFLSFLERRVESRAVAEEILQSAFAKASERGPEVDSEESAVAWFYRVLRNALVDHYRRSDVERRGLSAYGREVLSQPEAIDAELKDTVCGCFRRLLPTLKQEYADILDRADLEERPLSEVADALGVTRNNATVRLHRARQALRKKVEESCGTCATHGCLDCTCGESRRER